jgi:hypothetical protein
MVSGAAMASSRWERLCNGDEDVASPFHKWDWVGICPT